MTRNKTLEIFAFMALVLSGCSSLTTPVLRHETGEVLGSGKYRVAGRYEQGQMFAIVPTSSSLSGVTQEGAVYKGGLLSAHGAIGVLTKLELQLGAFLALSGGGWKVGAKYQALGSPLASAGPGNFAVSGQLYYARQTNKGTVNYLDSTGSQVSVEQIMSDARFDISVPVSYRVMKDVAIYSGPGMAFHSISGTANGTAGNFSETDLSFNLGVKINYNQWEGDLECAFSKSQDVFSGTSMMQPYFGFGVGIVF